MMTSIWLLTSLLIGITYSTDYTGCIKTGSGSGADITLNAATDDTVLSSSGDVRFIVESSNGDACLQTRDTASNQFGKRWCISYENGNVFGDSVIVSWTGNLTYLNGANQIWSSNTGTAMDTSPISLCVTDCGRVRMLRSDNGAELWNPDYINNFPTVYPTCPPPTNAPTAIPTASPSVITASPTKNPTAVPTTATPTTVSPTASPTVITSPPTKNPTTASPTGFPTVITSSPSKNPTTVSPTANPTTSAPTKAPTDGCGLYRIGMAVFMVFVVIAIY